VPIKDLPKDYVCKRPRSYYCTAPFHRSELHASAARSNFWRSTRPEWPSGDRACAAASVAAARRWLITSYYAPLSGARSRGGLAQPPARAPCGSPRQPHAGVLGGGVTAFPVGVPPRRRATAVAVRAPAPLFPPRASPATEKWLLVHPCLRAAMEQAGGHSADASTSTSAPWRPEDCTHVSGISFDRLEAGPCKACDVTGETAALASMRGSVRMVGDWETARVAARWLTRLVSSTRWQVCFFDNGALLFFWASQISEPVRARILERTCLQSPGLLVGVLPNLRIGASIIMCFRTSARCGITSEKAASTRRDLVRLGRTSPFEESHMFRSVTSQCIYVCVPAAWPYFEHLWGLTMWMKVFFLFRWLERGVCASEQLGTKIRAAYDRVVRAIDGILSGTCP